MKALIATTLVVLSGCATGYGCLAGMASGASIGLVADAAATSQTHPFDAMWTVNGLAIGLLGGCVGGAVSAAVARSEEHEALVVRAYWQRRREQLRRAPLPAASALREGDVR